LHCCFFSFVFGVYCGSERDFGVVWGRRARRICQNMAENRKQRQLCESVEEAVEEAFTGQGDHYTTVGVGTSSVTQLWERAEVSPWRDAAEGLIEDITAWVLETGEKKVDKIAKKFEAPFMQYLMKLAAEDKQNLEMRGLKKMMKNGNLDPEMMKAFAAKQQGANQPMPPKKDL